MAATRDRRGQSRRMEDQLLHWLATDSTEVLSVVDRGGAITFVTPSSERLFGWSPGELEGRPAEALFHPDDLRALDGRPADGERRSGTRMRCRHRDGSWRTVEARVRPIVARPGAGSIGLVVLSRDVTAEGAAHQELRQTARRLAEVERSMAELQRERDELRERLGNPVAVSAASERLKTEFLQMVSHELRTPLTAILGFSDLLSGDPLLKDRSELEIIRRNGRRLLDIIEDMLTIARAEAGELELRPVATDVAATARRVADSLRRSAVQKGLVLSVEAAATQLAQADELAVTSILRHLLNNAIKFTGSGEVVLRVTAGDGQVRLAVEDTGEGVPEPARASIFKDFTQVDQSITRRHGGIGVGLSLARRLVALQGGHFGLDSRTGGGSIFWFTLPSAG